MHHTNTKYYEKLMSILNHAIITRGTATIDTKVWSSTGNSIICEFKVNFKTPSLIEKIDNYLSSIPTEAAEWVMYDPKDQVHCTEFPRLFEALAFASRSILCAYTQAEKPKDYIRDSVFNKLQEAGISLVCTWKDCVDQPDQPMALLNVAITNIT